jgi:hypothetical protein
MTQTQDARECTYTKHWHATLEPNHTKPQYSHASLLPFSFFHTVTHVALFSVNFPLCRSLRQRREEQLCMHAGQFGRLLIVLRPQEGTAAADSHVHGKGGEEANCAEARAVQLVRVPRARDALLRDLSAVVLLRMHVPEPGNAARRPMELPRVRGPAALRPPLGGHGTDNEPQTCNTLASMQCRYKSDYSMHMYSRACSYLCLQKSQCELAYMCVLVDRRADVSCKLRHKPASWPR